MYSLDLPRAVDSYDIDTDYKPSDIFLHCTPERALQQLLLHRSTFCNELQLSKKRLQVLCTASDSTSTAPVVFNLKIKHFESSSSIMTFEKVQGDILQLHAIIQKIQEVLVPLTNAITE